MKRMFVLLFCAATFAIYPARAGHAVAPETCTFTNCRGESAQLRVASVDFYRGTSVTFTNCVLFTGTNGTPRQGLDAVTLEIRVGTTETNTPYTGVVSDTNGVWGCTVTVPSLSSAFVQVKITDANTNSYIYPWKILTTADPLD